MKATARPLHGEHYQAWEISVDANESRCYAKLLKRATRLARDLDPDSVHLSGITWTPTDDTYRLYVFESRS